MQLVCELQQCIELNDTEQFGANRIIISNSTSLFSITCSSMGGMSLYPI